MGLHNKCTCRKKRTSSCNCNIKIVNKPVEILTGTPGKDGLSAYEIAVLEGFRGSQSDWIESIKGVKGDPGIQGIQGIPGVKGEDGEDGQPGEDGLPGDSVEFRFQLNTSFSQPPALNKSQRNPTGWTIEQPNTSPGNYLWATQSYIDYNNDLVGEWSDPFRYTGEKGDQGNPGQDGSDGEDGSDGFDGISSARVLLYQRSSTIPNPPSTVVTYNFDTGEVSNLSGNWSIDIPTDDGRECWVTGASVTSLDNNGEIPVSRWSEVVKLVVSGEDGEDGNDGTDGLNQATIFLFTTTEEETPVPDSPTTTGTYNFNTGEISSINNNWTKTLSSSGGRFRWMIQATAISTSSTDDIEPSEWSTPVIVYADGIPGKRGPSLAYRGDWSSVVEYRGSEEVVDFVKYNNQGYIARIDAEEIPVGTLPSDEDFWNGPIPNVDALYTDFLIAYSAYIDNLTVGSIQTAVPPTTVPDPNNQGARFTAGYQPTDSSDPTYGYSRHWPRLYYPSGRIMKVETYLYPEDEIIFGGETYSDTGAIIFYKDEEGSPIHYIIDSKISEINWGTSATNYYPVYLLETNMDSQIPEGELDISDLVQFLKQSHIKDTVYKTATGYPMVRLPNNKYYRAQTQGQPDKYKVGTTEQSQSLTGWYIVHTTMPSPNTSDDHKRITFEVINLDDGIVVDRETFVFTSFTNSILDNTPIYGEDYILVTGTHTANINSLPVNETVYKFGSNLLQVKQGEFTDFGIGFKNEL